MSPPKVYSLPFPCCAASGSLEETVVPLLLRSTIRIFWSVLHSVFPPPVLSLPGLLPVDRFLLPADLSSTFPVSDLCLVRRKFPSVLRPLIPYFSCKISSVCFPKDWKSSIRISDSGRTDRF